MNYEHLWKILEALMVELAGKGVTIPEELVDDLKSARLYTLTYKTNLTEPNIIEELEIHLKKLESNLLYLAESEVGKDYADRWLNKIYETRMEEAAEIFPKARGLITGIPKGEHWIRISLLGLPQNVGLHELLKTLNLSTIPQENDCILVHGKEEDIKTFVKKISEKIGAKKK